MQTDKEWIGEAGPEIVQKGDWWWPVADQCARGAIITEVTRAIPWVLSVVKGGTVVQAGGNVGVYPALMSKHFDEIHSFEPDPDNYECLVRNLAERTANVRHFNAALGAEEGFCSVVHFEPNNCGAHKIAIEDEDGIPVMTIDGLDVKPSLIWLDIEGHELEALKGAQRTLSVCSPVIILEVKGLGDDPTDWLAARGYTERARLGNDIMYMRDQ